MPEAYEKMRDALRAKGKGPAEAAAIAAATYNKHRKPGSTPMGPNYEQRKRAGK